MAFNNISRGLFHQHRLPFTFLLAASIAQSSSDASNFHTLIHLSKAINGITLCSDNPSASNNATASQAVSRSASSLEKHVQNQRPQSLDPICWSALCKLAADVPGLENIAQAVQNDVAALTAYASEDGGDSRRPAMWLRQPPCFQPSTDTGGDEASPRKLSLSERCLIALCWHPGRLRAIMQVLTSTALHACEYPQVHSCACCFVMQNEHPAGFKK